MDAIVDFNNHLPIKIRFGVGRSLTLPTVLNELGATHIFLMVDQDIERFNPAAVELLELLEAQTWLQVTRFDKAPTEPTIEMVDAATAAFLHSGARVIVALGGGSVIDTAKAARLCAQLRMSFREFLAQRPAYREPECSLVAIPTSAGTGSEVSGGSVISDPQAGTKTGIAHSSLRAQYALVDPVLTYSMPPTMTANTGIDALAQAIAAMVAHVRTPIGDAIALEAIRMMTPALVAAYRDGADVAARSAMSCGSMMAGLAMNISDCTAEHSLGQAIGGLTHVPHGLTIGLVLVETLDRERHVVPEILERVADAMGVARTGNSDGSRCTSKVREVLAELNFPVLASLGVTSSNVDQLAELALQDYFITMSPQPWTKEEVVTVFERALSLSAR